MIKNARAIVHLTATALVQWSKVYQPQISGGTKLVEPKLGENCSETFKTLMTDNSRATTRRGQRPYGRVTQSVPTHRLLGKLHEGCIEI